MNCKISKEYMKKCLITAEIGINHNGDINLAKQLIEKSALAGCDYVKFQKRDIDLVYSKEDLDKYRESPRGTTNREQKYGLEFNKNEYDQISSFCLDKNIQWFGSPWDVNSVEFLSAYNPPFMKVASALITDFELLDRIKKTNIPVILSTGMSTREEVCKAVDFLGDSLVYILACTSTYPTLTNEVNLQFISTLKKEFPKHKIGFSNHHPGIFFAAASVALGAEMVEFHVTLDRAMYGSDQSASIEMPGVVKLCEYIKDLSVAIGDGEWKVFDSEMPIKDKLRRK